MDDEIRLIHKIQKNGSKAAADALIRKYYDEIYIYVFRQASDKNDAMDLTQDIFISVLKTIGGYDHRKSSFRTWLYHIATNKIIDHLRHFTVVSKKTIDADELDFVDEKDFTLHIETKFMLNKLQDYVNTLGIDIQQIFRLKFFGEYTFQQIADVLSIREPTVKSKYYRLLKQLRKEFSDEYKDAQ